MAGAQDQGRKGQGRDRTKAGSRGQIIGRPGGWTDEQVLQMLDMADGDGMTAAEIALRMGTSRSAICGILFRVRSELAESEQGSRVTRPENRDGALPRGWWRERARAVA